MAALVLVLLVSLGACSAGNQKYSGGGMADMAAEAPMAAPEPMRAMDMEYESAAADMAYEEDGVDSGAGITNISSKVQDGRKITFSASLSVNTKNFDADYKAINNLISQSGGYVANENYSDYTSYGRNEGRYSWMSIRIPSDKYDTFLGGISSVGDVTNMNKGSEDLTSQYYDTEARIEMLELRKDRLMSYLVEAEEAADIVEFERELSNVLYELDQYQGNKRYLDRLVDYASVDLDLTELITPETIGKDGEPLGDRASAAFGLSANGVGRFLQNAVVFLAGAVPVIILIVVILAIVWVVLRVTRNHREKARDRREERQDSRAQKRAQRNAQRNANMYYQQYAQQAQGQPQPEQQAQQPVQDQPVEQAAQEPVQEAASTVEEQTDKEEPIQ